MNKTINVCLTINEKWATFASVTITSIMDNTNADVQFFVLHTGLEPHTIERINQLTNKFHKAHIEYKDVSSDLFNGFNPIDGYISIDTFSKCLFADLYTTVERVIYTDVDVIFNGDIEEIFDIDLNKHIIGAVPGISHMHGRDNERLKIEGSHCYFQAGLLLIDCKKWRDFKITSKLCELSKQNLQLEYADQDLLNIVFENQYKSLDQKYCVIPWQLNEMKTLSAETKLAAEKPFIIHYCGGDKPWLRKTKLDEYFWKYAQLTDFYRKIQVIFLEHSFKSKECDVSTKQYRLFKHIPLMKIKRKIHYNITVDRYFLFNSIPILKKIDKPNEKIWSTFFDVQVLKLNKINKEY